MESFDFLCSFEFIQAMAYFSVRSGSLFTLFHSERKKNKGGRHRALKIASVAEVDTHLGSYVSLIPHIHQAKHDTRHTAEARGRFAKYISEGAEQLSVEE